MTPKYSVATCFGVLLVALVFPRFSLYRTWRGAPIFEEVRALSFAWATVLFLLFAFAFATQTGTEYSRIWIGYWSFSAWLGLVAERVSVRVVLRKLRQKGFNQRRIIVVGASALGRRLVHRLTSQPWLGLTVDAIFCTDVEPNGGRRRMCGRPVFEGLDKVAAYVERARIDQVWITLPLKEENRVQKLLHDLRHNTADIRYLPDIFGFQLLNHSVTEIAGFPVINLSTSPMEGSNRVVKAIEDWTLALVILLLVSPLMVLIAIGVKLTSAGPVFYRQERIGWNGNTFMMLKFRSMPIDVEKNGIRWGEARTKQTTRLGGFLRRTSLDELPQFINVLKGDMSIVGPRPERPMFVEKFKNEIPDYMKKHMVKAGITGWAQVNGWRGDTDLTKRVEYDLYYIENWSIWFDLRIILFTVFRGFLNKHAC